MMDLFDRLAALLGDEKSSVREFGEILDAGFGEIQVGVIPATVDRVVVGDITRTRLDHIQVLFFVGVNDGIVPVKKEKVESSQSQTGNFWSRMTWSWRPRPERRAFFSGFTCIWP